MGRLFFIPKPPLISDKLRFNNLKCKHKWEEYWDPLLQHFYFKLNPVSLMIFAGLCVSFLQDVCVCVCVSVGTSACMFKLDFGY